MLGNFTMRNGKLDAPFVMGMSQHLPQVLDFNTELFDVMMAYCHIIMHGRVLNVLFLIDVSQHPPQVLNFIAESSDDMLTRRNIVVHRHERSSRKQVCLWPHSPP